MIDDAGNITLDRAEDSFLPFGWDDEDDQSIDLSELSITFVVKGGFSLVPDIHPDNGRNRLLHFTPAHAALIGSKTREYMVHVHAGDGTQKVLWRGMISAGGFAV